MDIYSHELRGPLCAVMQSAEGIVEAIDGDSNPLDPESGGEYDPDEQPESLRIINDALHCRNSKLDSNRMSISVEPVDARFHHWISVDHPLWVV